MGTNQPLTLSRRNFLKVAGAAAAAGTGLIRPNSANSATPEAPSFESKYSVCDMCFNKCSLIARVRNGVVEKLDPNPKFHKSRGMLCARGNAGVRQLYDPDRLKSPLLRKGERGEGKWQRLTWDQALDHAAEQLLKIGEQYTRCGVMFMAGADMQSTFVHRFADVYGSYNKLSHESMCLIAGTRGFLDTFGEVPIPDMQYTKYVVMSGANRFEALVTPDSMDLMKAMAGGCKLVVLDPRYTKTAALAHEYFPVRPGTDMAVMLAFAHVLITEGLYDREFVEQKCYGIEQLAEHVKQYSPEWAEKECEIPAEAIRRIAREMAAAAPQAMIYPGRRSSNYRNSTQIRRAYAIVNALLGNWDRPGGLTAARMVGLKSPGYDAPFYESNPFERIDHGVAKLMFEEEGSLKIARDAVLREEPYPVKGFFTYKTNPMQTAANRSKTIEMIRKLDFMCTVDIVMSDTAWMADLVLPSQAAFERTDPCSAQQGSSACACVVMRDPVVSDPLFESKPVFWMMKELADRLDLGEYFDLSIEEYRKEQLRDLPGAMDALINDGVYYNPSKLYGVYEGRIFKTKTHKIELFNETYQQMGLDPLPVYESPTAPPKNQFRMVVGRTATITQSSSQNNSLLQEFEPENDLWIHPDSAAALGIHDGDPVTVSGKVGEQRIRARVTRRTRPDTVYMHTGYGVLSKGLSRLQGKGACIAQVLEDGLDEISGNMAMHETFVKITKEKKS